MCNIKIYRKFNNVVATIEKYAISVHYRLLISRCEAN